MTDRRNRITLSLPDPLCGAECSPLEGDTSAPAQSGAFFMSAISPIEMYVSLDPVKRRTPQTTKVISEYAERGDCEKSYATGTVRVPFAVGLSVRTLSVVVNNVAGTLILDTGATFVSITSRFALKARVATESGSQVIMKTVGGKALADIGYADSMSVGKAAAFGVTTAVVREDGDPFGRGVDGLLGMSFQGRELPLKEVQSAHRGAGGRRGGQARRTEVWAPRPAALLRELVHQSEVARRHLFPRGDDRAELAAAASALLA